MSPATVLPACTEWNSEHPAHRTEQSAYHPHGDRSPRLGVGFHPNWLLSCPLQVGVPNLRQGLLHQM